MKQLFIIAALIPFTRATAQQTGVMTAVTDTVVTARGAVAWNETPNRLNNVTIHSTTHPFTTATYPVGMERMTARDLKYIPVFFGEKDLLKTIQLLPGIKSAGDGNTGFYVRGGGADQNLILLDGAPVYNPSHLMGFFSVFNGDAVKDLTIYKGNMPAQYGGRLSSVLDVNMNEGSSESYKVSGGIGLIATRLSVEGPLQKNRSSFMVSGRRTYADLFLRLSSDSALRNNDLNFYDLNFKMNYAVGAKDQLTISAYTGHDLMRINTAFRLDWGNKIASLQWKHLSNNKSSIHTSLYYSHYNYTAAVTSNKETYSAFSEINDLGIKTETQWKSGRHENRIGLQAVYRTMYPGQISPSSVKTETGQPLPQRASIENAVYAGDSWQVSSKLQVNYGLRLSAFSILGRGDFYEVNAAGKITDTLRYNSNQVIKTYFNAEPRIAGSYALGTSGTISFAYARNVQPLHLLGNTTAATPTDRWIASNNIIQPGIADQISAGYCRKIHQNSLSLSVEAYYKLLQHEMDYRDGAEIFNNAPVETKLLFGQGRAYGIECLLKKKKGNLTGWISYCLSRAERKINGISNNEWYRAKQDRTHELAIVASIKLAARWMLSANWVFSTGNAVTLPAGKYVIRNRMAYYYTERNGYRMPAYHRLDLAATVQLSRKKSFSSELNFGVYNAYGRENPYSIYFRNAEQDPTQTEAVQMALFRFVPSVTYNFKF